MDDRTYHAIYTELLELADDLGVADEVQKLPRSVFRHPSFTQSYMATHGTNSLGTLFHRNRYLRPTVAAARLSWLHSWIWRCARRTQIDALREDGASIEFGEWDGRRELEAWAAACGVSTWLDVMPYVPSGYGYGGDAQHGLTYGDLAARGPLRHCEVTRHDRREAIAVLRRAADEAARAISRENLTAWDPKNFGDVADAVEPLVALRNQLRTQSAPRRPTGEVQLSLKDGGVWYIEMVQPGCGDHRSPARIFVERQTDGEWEVRCGCSFDCEKLCGPKLSAVDATLDLLAGVHSSGASLRKRLQADLATPPWRRAVDQFAAALTTEADVEFGWEVKTHDDGWESTVRLYPVEVRQAKRGGGVKLKRIRQDDWASTARRLGGVDGQVLRELARARRYSLHNDWDTLGDLIAELAGCDNVFVRSARNALTIEAHHAAAELHLGDDGVTHFAPSFGDVPIADSLFESAMELPDRWVCRLEGDALRLFVVPSDVVQLSMRAGLLGRFPKAAQVELLERVAPSIAAGRLSLSADSRGEEQEPDDHLALDLELDQNSLRVQIRSIPIAGGTAYDIGRGTEQVHGAADGTRFWVQRNLEDEVDRAQALAAHLGLEPDPEWIWSMELADESFAFLEALAEIEDRGDVVVRWHSRPIRALGTVRPSNVTLQVGTLAQWLTIGGTATLESGDTIAVEQLIAAARDGKRWVEIDGGLAQIEERLRARLAALQTKDVSPFLAPVLIDLEDEGTQIASEGSSWRELSEKMREATMVQPQLPHNLQATLRPYQRSGFDWLMRLARWAPGAILADDMGLGKTLQALAVMLARREDGPTLVVAPTSVAFNWRREAARFTPDLEVRLIRSGATIDRLDDIGSGCVVITSYGLATRYVDDFANVAWGTVVYDEAQALKNPATQRAKAARAIEGEFTLALTGTPIENRSDELWSAFRVVVPGLLGSHASFRDRFAVPIERHGDEAAARALAMLVSPFVLRRLKRDVARDLPDRIETRLDVELSAGERSLYDGFRARLLEELGGQDVERFAVLAAITRLRQLACHPGLVDPTHSGHSSKTVALVERLTELAANGQRALVFSQFTSLLDLVEPALSETGLSYLRLDGSTPPNRREQLVDEFQQKTADVFLLSTKAAGQGLNLTAATQVFHLDPWWNPATEDQATDRAHRIGQSEPVTVVRMVATGTIEEAIYDLHESKRALVDSLLAGAGSARALTPEELRLLVESGGYEAPDLEESLVLDEPQSSQASARDEDPLELVTRTILDAVQGGEITQGTASAYRPKARRLVTYMADHGHPLNAEGVDHAMQSYVHAIERGEFHAPKSDIVMASAVATWVARAFSRNDASK